MLCSLMLCALGPYLQVRRKGIMQITSVSTVEGLVILRNLVLSNSPLPIRYPAYPPREIPLSSHSRWSVPGQPISLTICPQLPGILSLLPSAFNYLDILSLLPSAFNYSSFVISATLKYTSLSPIPVSPLLDSGATVCFMDRNFAQKHAFSLIKLLKPIPVEVIDGCPISSGLITFQTSPIPMRIGNHVELLSFLIISSPHHPVILGLSWLILHNPIIDWHTQAIKFPYDSDPPLEISSS